MGSVNFTIDINPAIWQQAEKLAQGNNQTINQLLTDLVAAYARGESLAQEAPQGDVTEQQVVIALPDQVLLLAQQRIRHEHQQGEQLLAELLTGYVESRPALPEKKAPATTKPGKPATEFNWLRPPVEGATTPTTTTPETEAVNEPIVGESYDTLPIVGPHTDRPADKHADLNMELRGYVSVDEPRHLIDIPPDGNPDSNSPQLYGLFKDERTPTFTATYRVRDWHWGPPPHEPGSPGEPFTKWKVSLVGMQTSPGETIHVPNAGYDIGRGHQVLVLFADDNQITLKYTGEDNVIKGYAIHVADIFVEPRLLALYQQQGSFQRGQLPALKTGQAFGRAKGSAIKVAIRDTGQWMDPRSRGDWWRGR